MGSKMADVQSQLEQTQADLQVGLYCARSLLNEEHMHMLSAYADSWVKRIYRL